MASAQSSEDDAHLAHDQIEQTNTGIPEPQSHVGTALEEVSDGNSRLSHVGTISGFDGVDSGIMGGHSRAGTVSVVGSVAFTITSTIVTGLVHTVAHWKVLLLGQAISLVLAAAGASNEVLDLECGVSTPSTYNAFAYGIVTLFGLVAFKRESKKLMADEIDEEQLRFHVGAEDEDADDNSADSEDDLTVEHESPTRRSFFTIRGNYTTDAKSHGSKSKTRSKYAFLCGSFTIHAKWYYYFLLALIETQAYYFIFLAFRYTSFTFVYISDALAIPSAMMFTRAIMKKRYSWTHLLGASVCIIGIVINTVSDMENKDLFNGVSSADHIKGDIYAILGAILLGLDDVLSEIVVTDYGGVNEMIFMKGFYGTAISLVQLLIFELDSVITLFGTEGTCDISKRMILFSIHVGTRSLDFAGEMQFLYLSEAALLNLSLLTSDLYAALFDIVTVGLELTKYYYIAFLLIFTGIVLYESGPSPSRRLTDAPVDIEIHRVRKRASIETTEHAGNVAIDIEAELT